VSGLSQYFDNHVLDYVFGNVAYSPPTLAYVGLSSTNILDDGTGETPPSGNYNRVAVPNNTTVGWNAAVAGVKTNATPISFPTASAPWTNVSYFGVWDQSTGGNLMAKGSLTPAQTVNTGSRLTIDTGAMTISLT
jgi:hypothetical protein